MFYFMNKFNILSSLRIISMSLCAVLETILIQIKIYHIQMPANIIKAYERTIYIFELRINVRMIISNIYIS